MPSELIRQERAKRFKDTTEFTSVLLSMLVDMYGTECFEWEPETIKMELEGEFNTRIPRVNLDKIHAGITLLTTNNFYRDPVSFWHTVLAFTDRVISFQYLDEDLDAEDIAWAVAEAAILDPPDEDSEWGEEVAAFIGVILKQDGFYKPPSLLKFALMPTKDQILDAETEQAIMKRQSDLEEDLLDFVRERTHKLRESLMSAPLLSSNSSRSHEQQVDFLGKLFEKQRSRR